MGKRGKLFVSVFVLLLVSKLYSYSEMAWVIDDGRYSMPGTTNMITAGLNYLALIIAFCLSFNAPYAKNIKNRFLIPLMLITLAVLMWTIISIAQIGVVDTLYSSTTPIVYSTIFMIFLGGDSDCWNTMKKIAMPFAVFCLAFAYITFTSAQAIMSNMERLSGNTPIMVFYVTGFWWTATCCIDFKERSMKFQLATLLLILCCALFAFQMTTRSWMIQSCLIMLLALSQMGKSKFKKFMLYTIAIVGIICLLQYISADAAWSEYVEALEQKNQDDTRSFQYEEIFSQVSFMEWVTGGGIDATYISQTGGGGAYGSIDNQFIFAFFHYGFLLALPFFYIWLSGLYKIYRCKTIAMIDKSYMFVVLFWLFALGGLSVFNVVVINQQTILLSFILGHCIYKSSLRVPSK